MTSDINYSLPSDSSLTSEQQALWGALEQRYCKELAQADASVVQPLKMAVALSPFVADVLLAELPYVLAYSEQWDLAKPLAFESIEQTLSEQLGACQNDNAAKQVLRRWRSRIFVLIAIRNLVYSSSITIDFQDISYAADRLILSAYHWVFPRLSQQFGTPLDEQEKPLPLLILAMGKYGGKELNFSSDVDLMFFFPHDGETQKGPRQLEHQTFFTRLGQQIIALLADRTGDGFVFRVDMRLRPYGESGPLAMSFAAAEEYYQDQGREWERFALIKARIINSESYDIKSNDLNNAQTEHYKEMFYQLIKPFVYRRYIDFGVLESIRNMKTMIETEVRRKGLTDNIKLGSGGIREAEFIVQSLQLIRGGRIRHIQRRSFIKALEQLKRTEIIQPRVAEKLLESYLFLRRVEHVIQQLHDQQTQLLPDNPLDQTRLTVALGFSQYGQFMDELSKHQQVISAEFSEVFHVDDEEELDAERFSLDILERDDFEHWYTEHDSSVVPAMMVKLQRFVGSNSFQHLSSRGKSRMESLFPKLLNVLSRESDPVVSFERILDLLRSISRRTAYLVLLEENPPVLEHLVKLCGQSKWVSEQMIEHPLLLDELLYPNALYTPLDSSELTQELRRQLLRIEPDDEEQQQEQLRIFKQTHELRVAAAVLNNTINVKKASRYLSQIAEAIIASVIVFSWRKLCQRYGLPSIEGVDQDRMKGFAVIGYGKFGGEELGFGSDLDLVFLFDAEPEATTSGERSQSHTQFFTRLAQRVIHALNMRTVSGVLYDVDMRLRPSGKSGLLVSYTESFKDYQLNEAWTWEHQALSRARAVAGDKDLCQWFEQLRCELLAKPRDAKQLKQDVITMREKMRKQLDKSQGDKFDLKQGTGGMVDIEFLAQYLLLANGASFPQECWSSRTTRQFIRLNELDILSREQADHLIEAYRYYRELNNRIVLTGQSKQLPFDLVCDHSAQVSSCWQAILGKS